MSHIPYRRVEAHPFEDLPSPARSCLSVVSFLAAVAFVGVIIFAGVVPWLDAKYATWNTQNVKTITGVPADPTNNNVDIQVVSPGLGSTPLPLTNTLLLENTGVLSNIAGTGIGVSSATGNSIISTTALLTINSNAGVANNFDILGSGGIVVSTVGNQASISTSALLTLNGNPGAANNFDIVAGSGIGILTVGAVATVSTSAVLTMNALTPTAGNMNLAASFGLAVASAGSTITYEDVLAAATQLADTDPTGPLVRYESAIGFFVPVPENSGWRTGLVPGFPQPYIPGAVTGDSGLGDQGGTGWTVPAIGTYTVNADCEIIPDAIAVNDMQVVHVAMSLAALSEDPYFMAIIPAGGRVSLDISGGTNANVAPPTRPRTVSLSSTFQAGCPSCLVQVGDALQFHASMERTGVLPGPFAFSAYCTFEVATVR